MTLTPSSESIAVLDACVLAPMPVCNTLLRLAEEPALYRPIWSTQTLIEVERTLRDRFRYTAEQAIRRIRAMDEAFPESVVQPPQELLDSILTVPDPDDRHVIAAAICAHADVIVTENLKHFPEELLTSHHLHLKSTDGFLVDTYRLDPEIVVKKLEVQASAIRLRRAEVLHRLERVAPQFVSLVLAHVP